jgi:hypothetical protein
MPAVPAFDDGVARLTPYAAVTDYYLMRHFPDTRTRASAGSTESRRSWPATRNDSCTLPLCDVPRGRRSAPTLIAAIEPGTLRSPRPGGLMSSRTRRVQTRVPSPRNANSASAASRRSMPLSGPQMRSLKTVTLTNALSHTARLIRNMRDRKGSSWAGNERPAWVRKADIEDFSQPAGIKALAGFSAGSRQPFIGIASLPPAAISRTTS